MARVIQIRNVPEALHRVLKVRARTAGMSLSGYLLRELQEIADRPTLAEFGERLRSRGRLSTTLDTVRLLREERATR
jgi:plasmid stability protein